ncbi:MAG: acyl-CoA dehydrogenase family protein [Dehalococcoidia bacterium]|nr:acyl-CoA dehydrogenase family protein [Dehalococcoidia bacterium]
MDLGDSPQEAAFREEVREFVREHGHKARGGGRPAGGDDGGEGMPDPETMRARMAGMQAWREALVAKGWIAPAWPKEYGGAGLTVLEQFVLNEELAEHGLSAGMFGGMGVMMLGPTLLTHGTEEQKAEHIPRILSGEARWAQGYSEPGAGSDLASLQTRAVRDGDEFVINGQKIWATAAQFSNWIFMLARTDPDAPKHRGISYFLIDRQTPGIEIRPLTTMANQETFNEMFFEDVRVPAKNVVGEVDRGWYVGATTLDFERSGIGSAVGTMRGLQNMLKRGKDAPDATYATQQSPTWRLDFADRIVEANIARQLSNRVITLQARGMIPNYEASISKLFTTELRQRIARTHLKMYGLYGVLWDKNRAEAEKGRAATGYLDSVSSTLAGGTSEIQRNVIATRGLGLPRG